MLSALTSASNDNSASVSASGDLPGKSAHFCDTDGAPRLARLFLALILLFEELPVAWLPVLALCSAESCGFGRFMLSQPSSEEESVVKTCTSAGSCDYLSWEFGIRVSPGSLVAIDL